MTDYLNEPSPWEAVEEAKAEPLNIEEMDNLVREMKSLEEDYTEKKRVSTEAWHLWQAHRGKVLSALQASNKSKYPVDGLGTVSVVTKMKYKMPKTIEDKAQVMEWLQSFGNDVFIDKVTVNHNTFNSLCNQEVEMAAERGETLSIPGVADPVAEFEVRFRKG